MINQLPFPENLLCYFEKPALVMYVEDDKDTEINGYIQEYYEQIVNMFAVRSIDFGYLPFLQKTIINPETIADSYKKLKQLLLDPFKGPGLVWIDGDKDGAQTSAMGCQLTDEHPLSEQFELFAGVISNLKELTKE